MKILAVDTSTSVNTVAVCAEGRTLAETVVECGRAHAERLMSTVDWVLNEAGLSLDELDALAVSVGPGSFTGLRIGVAAWKGLALATGKPLVGVPTLDALVRTVGVQHGTICTLLDAKMREVFGTIYHVDAGIPRKLREDCVAPVAVLLTDTPPGTMFVGDGAALYRAAIVERCAGAIILDGPLGTPRASAVCAVAADLLTAGRAGRTLDVAPVYLRMSQPEVARLQVSS